MTGQHETTNLPGISNVVSAHRKHLDRTQDTTLTFCKACTVGLQTTLGRGLDALENGRTAETRPTDLTDVVCIIAETIIKRDSLH